MLLWFFIVLVVLIGAARRVASDHASARTVLRLEHETVSSGVQPKASCVMLRCEVRVSML